VIPVRIGIDKNNNLAECPIEFEVLQEFNSSGPPLGVGGGAGVGGVVGIGTEKITLGVVKINLSEYVEESEALLRESRRASFAGSDRDRPLTANTTSGHSRKRSSLSLGGSTAGGESLLSKSVSSYHTTSTAGEETFDPLKPSTTATSQPIIPDIEEGVIRRHLMQESKINSTLKIGILMIQIDGERNYVAPPLKTAPVFGGIAGLMASGDATAGLDAPEAAVSSSSGGGPATAHDASDPSMAGKSRDIYEAQDVYRRALAASWASEPGEMPADECIEDIFSGGDGFRDPAAAKPHQKLAATAGGDGGEGAGKSGKGGAKSGVGSGHTTGGGNNSGKSPSSGSGDDELMGTLRPHHLARLRHHFHRGSGERTAFPAFKDPGTVGGGGNNSASGGAESGVVAPQVHFQAQHQHRREPSKDESSSRSRSESLASLATTVGSDRGRDGFKKPREVVETDVREDFVAWTMPGVVS
jgi:hypothetical protein